MGRDHIARPKTKYCDLEILAWRTLPPFNNWLRHSIIFFTGLNPSKGFRIFKISNLFSGAYATIESPPTRQQQHEWWPRIETTTTQQHHDHRRTTYPPTISGYRMIIVERIQCINEYTTHLLTAGERRSVPKIRHRQQQIQITNNF